MKLTYEERMKRLRQRGYVRTRKPYATAKPTPEQLEERRDNARARRIAASILQNAKLDAALDAKIATYVLKAPEALPKALFVDALRDVYLSWHLPRVPPLAPSCYVTGTRTGGYERVWIVPPHEVQKQLSTAA